MRRHWWRNLPIESYGHKYLIWDTQIMTPTGPRSVNALGTGDVVTALSLTEHEYGMGDAPRAYSVEYLPHIRVQTTVDDVRWENNRIKVNVVQFGGSELVCSPAVEVLVWKWGWIEVGTLDYRHELMVYSPKSSLLRKVKIKFRTVYNPMDREFYAKTHNVQSAQTNWLLTQYPHNMLLGNGLVVR